MPARPARYFRIPAGTTTYGTAPQGKPNVKTLSRAQTVKAHDVSEYCYRSVGVLRVGNGGRLLLQVVYRLDDCLKTLRKDGYHDLVAAWERADSEHSQESYQLLLEELKKTGKMYTRQVMGKDYYDFAWVGPTVCWTGAGGYWRYADIREVEEVTSSK